MMEKILMSPVVLSPGNRKITVFGGGRVALRKVKEGGAVDGEQLAPIYLRESQAETTRRFGGK